MRNLEFVRNLHPAWLATFLGYIADPKTKCPLKKFGICNPDLDCYEDFAEWLMQEQTDKDKKYWQIVFEVEEADTMKIINEYSN